MNAIDLLEPERLFKTQLKQQHHERVEKFFDELAKTSAVDQSQNQATCKKLYSKQESLKKAEKKQRNLKILKVLFIILCFIIVGIFLLIFVYKPRKKEVESLIEKLNGEIASLKNQALAEMAPLNALLDSEIPLKLFQETCPLIEMDRNFDVKKYEMLRDKYGMWDNSEENRSTLALQSGSILGNPFVFFKDQVTAMLPHTYTGTLVIHWTTTYRDKNGVHTQTHTQTLTATVVKPAPNYWTDSYLVYANDAAPHLTFSRGPSEMRGMDEKKQEKYVRRHEDDLMKLSEKQLGKGGTYTPLGNPKFELSFGGLDRNNEVEYRLLFTPLAQKAMIDLLFSTEGYGDDFKFKKDKCLNIIESEHSAGKILFAEREDFQGYDFESMKKYFIDYNDAYFRAIFFDFAPLLSIPLYQQMKPREYIYKNTVKSTVTPFEHEIMANRLGRKNFAHPDTDTDVILKSLFVRNNGKEDQVAVRGLSYKAIPHVELVPKLGGDGKFHNVPVTWYEYLPLEQTATIGVASVGGDEGTFLGLGNESVIYKKGIVAHHDDALVDINSLKSLMAKKEK